MKSEKQQLIDSVVKLGWKITMQEEGYRAGTGTASKPQTYYSYTLTHSTTTEKFERVNLGGLKILMKKILADKLH